MEDGEKDKESGGEKIKEPAQESEAEKVEAGQEVTFPILPSLLMCIYMFLFECPSSFCTQRSEVQIAVVLRSICE